MSLYFQVFTITTTFLSLIIVFLQFLPGMHGFPLHFVEFFQGWYGFLYFMWTWAYILACRTDNESTHCMSGFSEGRCDYCKKNKLDRAHHCSTCKKCIARMDHHCIWINNCVGYYNYKHFFLFVWYLTLGTFTYDYLALCYYLYAWDGTITAGFLISVVETSIVILTTILTSSLLFAHVMLILNNVTTIEYLRGTNVKFCGRFETSTNHHHMGPVANFIQIFGTNPLTWFLPLLPDTNIYAQFYPVVPYAN